MRIPQVGESFGPYHVERVLGRGGMGVVFVATQVTLNRSVALKVLLPQFAESDEYRRRFSREASALANAQSPHIVPIFDYGEIDGALFIATQLVPGSDLGTRIANAELDHGPILDIARHVATALADAHAVGVLHRDVKPSNVLIWDRAEGPHAYLCDFGIAKMDDGDHTTTEGTVGTWAFLSPERCNGEPATEASDIYSAGCVLWNMLTNTTPYTGTPVEIAMAHVSHPVPQRAVTSPLDAELNRILRTAMAKDPQARYPSAAMMADELREIRALLPRAAKRQNTPSYDETLGGVENPLHLSAPPSEPVAPDHLTELLGPSQTPFPDPSPQSRRGLLRGLVGLAVVALIGLLGWQAVTQGWFGASTGDPTDDPTSVANTPAAATCWDDTRAATIADCSDPTGLAGMAWAIPSIDTQDPSCQEKDQIEPGKTLVFVCQYRFRGASGIIRYSEWESAKIARDYYTDEYAAEPRKVVSLNAADRWLWRLDGRTEQGLYRMTTAYADWPFTVSIEASTRIAREAAYRQLTFRPADQMTGTTQESD